MVQEVTDQANEMEGLGRDGAASEDLAAGVVATERWAQRENLARELSLMRWLL